MATKRNQESYDSEFKAQAVKLAREIGGHKAAKESGVQSLSENKGGSMEIPIFSGRYVGDL